MSGKITNSVLTYVSRQGVSLEGLYDLTDLPEEFLRDPSCWVEAQKAERFLFALNREFSSKLNDPNLMETVGHHCHELWSWGVLDSVLRMMPNPQDVYQQPHRFLSYFFSPPPELSQIERENESIKFDMPWVVSEYPLTSEYLRAALEALPSYLGKQRAVARWRGHQVYIGWSEAQQSFFEAKESEAHFKPELVKAMRQSLELAQKELEEQKRELGRKDRQIEKYRVQLENLSGITGNGPQAVKDFFESRNMSGRLESLKEQLRRVDDYMVRAQQLVTILVGSGRKDSQVQEAMKRVDWDYLRSVFPQMIREMMEELRKLQKEWREAGNSLEQEEEGDAAPERPSRGSTDRQLTL